MIFYLIDGQTDKVSYIANVQWSKKRKTENIR